MDSKPGLPQIVLGTMLFGKQVDEAFADRMVGIFLDRGYREIDTAHNYGEGATEEVLGRILTPERRGKIYLATKVNPFVGGNLRPETIIKQLDTSLRRLRADSVDLLYLHGPDLKTRIEVTLQACQDLFKQGKFRELGLSNFASWQVAEIWHLCKQNGWIAPSVYQGMYNAITRDVDRELFPAIRNYGIRFYAYNPLAGGFLTGKYALLSGGPREGRFKSQQLYMDRYWNKAYFEAMDIFRVASEQAGLSMTRVALLWIMNQSRLKGQYRDGVILAASNLEQWETNLNNLSGELPQKVAVMIDQAWEKARPECPRYFRT